MASSFAFLMVSSSPCCLFQHWSWVLLLATLLSTSLYGPLLVMAEPGLIIHAASNCCAAGASPNDSAAVTPLHGLLYEANPLVTIPLPNLPNIEDFTSVLTISSPNDSAFEAFVIQVVNSKATKHFSLGETVIFAFLGVTLTNLCSLIGLICIPIKRLKFFNLILSYMMGLAVSALFSAALLILLPEAIRMADMPLEFGGQGRTYLLKLSCIPAGLLVFFCIEYVLLILPRLLKLRKPPNSDSSDPAESTIKVENTLSMKSGDSATPRPVAQSSRHRSSCLKCSVNNFAQIAPMAWMILLGDSVHNFMDGMAIAVGFTESPTVGVAICLCILFEELPHELGDFAVLITAGFSVKLAICANFASACTAYLGLIIGLVIGEVSSGALYVFAATSGVFLHVSLADMLPSIRETLEEAEKKRGSSLGIFVIQIGGLITGYACVLGVIFASDYISF
ncbi:Metal cation symporter ZIP8 [Taenia solium]|eukprot:TsM_000731300 transcript=TsM_000731300 gene=TsM_000731300